MIATQEYRRGHAEEGDDGQGVIQDTRLPSCGDNPEEHTHQNGDAQTGHREHQGVGQPGLDHIHGAGVEIIGVSEVAVEDIHEIVSELDRDGVVEPQLLPQRVDLGGVVLFTQHGRDRIARDQPRRRKGESNDDQQRRDELQQAFQDHFLHGSPTFRPKLRPPGWNF